MILSESAEAIVTPVPFKVVSLSRIRSIVFSREFKSCADDLTGKIRRYIYNKVYCILLKICRIEGNYYTNLTNPVRISIPFLRDIWRKAKFGVWSLKFGVNVPKFLTKTYLHFMNSHNILF